MMIGDQHTTRFFNDIIYYNKMNMNVSAQNSRLTLKTKDIFKHYT